MDREHDLLIRGERDREQAPEFDEPAVENAPPQGSMVEDALASTLTPGMSEAEAAELVEQLPEEEHEKVYEWLTEHLGADFAGRVTDLAGLQLAGDFTHDHDLGSVLDDALDSFAGDDLDMGLNDPIAEMSDPLMGDMEACVSTSAGFEVSVSEHSVSVQSPQGVGLRLGGANSAARASGFRFDLRSGDIDLQGSELSEVEQALLVQTLQQAFGQRSTRRNQDQPSELWDAPERATTTQDGLSTQLQGAESFLEASITSSGARVTFGGTLNLQAQGFAPVPLAGISYDFATGSVEFATFASGSFAPEDLQAVITSYGAQLAQRTLLDRLPSAMRQAGYSPELDPAFASNLQHFLAQYTHPKAPTTQAKDTEPLESQREDKTPEERVPHHEVPEENDQSGKKKQKKISKKYILLWEIDDPMLGLVRVLMRRKDRLSLVCGPTDTVLKTRFGLSLDVEGSPWTRALKVLSLLVDHTTHIVRWVSLTPLPDSVQRVADVLLRTRIAPLLPQPQTGSDASRHCILHNTQHPLSVWKHAQDSFSVSIHDTTIHLVAPQHITLHLGQETHSVSEASRNLESGLFQSASPLSPKGLEALSLVFGHLPGMEYTNLGD